MNSIESILNSDRLPSLPKIALQIIEITKSIEPDPSGIVKAIQCDPALSAQFLKVSNSVLFGFGSKTLDITKAVSKLGLNMVQSIALSFYLKPSKSKGKAWDLLLQKYWWRSLAQASAAEELGMIVNKQNASHYFLGGLLQDIGMLALLQTSAGNYVSAFASCDQPNFLELENKSIGFDHIAIGQQMFTQWGFDRELIEALSQHHTAIVPTEIDEHPETTVVMRTASLIADNFFSKKMEDGFHSDSQALELKLLLESYFGFQPGDENEFLFELEKRITEVAGGFNINIGEIPINEDLLAASSQLLSELAMKTLVDNSNSETSLRDPLTGLFNRRKLDEVRVSAADGTEVVGVLFVDVDRFKAINDEHGHQTGDDAICMIAAVLNEAVRDDDIVIRYGGDEFITILRNVNDELLESIAQRITTKLRDACSKSDVYSSITLSIGGAYEQLANLSTAHESYISEIIERADHAMYEAKRRGGDRICYATIENAK